MRRRKLIASVGVSLAAAATGCLRDDGGDGFKDRAALGNGPSVELSGAADRDFEFIDEDEGRIRVLYGDGRTDETGFDDWSEGVCRHTGARELSEYLHDKLNVDSDFGVGSGTVREELFEGYDGDPDELREALGDRTHTVYVSHDTVFRRDGGRAHEPEVGYEELVEATPREIRVTAVFEDHGIERDCTYPVVVRKRAVQED